jgi:hypothetical protein
MCPAGPAARGIHRAPGLTRDGTGALALAPVLRRTAPSDRLSWVLSRREPCVALPTLWPCSLPRTGIVQSTATSNQSMHCFRIFLDQNLYHCGKDLFST